MKNSELNRKNAGTAHKACVWILSIMLVVTGMAPSFARNVNAGKGSATASAKSVSNVKEHAKTKEEGTSKAKTAKKPDTDKKDVGASSKKQKSLKDKEDKNGKQNKIKSKRLQAFNLNSSGNVYAEFDGNDNLIVLAKDTSSDMNIEKGMWWRMGKSFGAEAGLGENTYGWYKTRVKNIIFKTKGIYLPEESSYFFQMIKGKIIGCNKLNTSKVTDMSIMFYGATSANPDVSQWDTSKVTDMSNMFSVATSANPDVSSWDTSKVNNMRDMFRGATSANPDVSKWDTSKATDMSGMFSGATSANPDVSKWDTSKATDMSNMFIRVTSANPDVSKWDTSKATDMSGMFSGATSANPDVSKWNTSGVKNMSNMFNEATSANPDVSKWNVSNVTDMSNMFSRATSANPDVSKWDTSKVIDMEAMFSSATSANPDVSKWNTSGVKNMRDMFNEATSANPDVSKWDTSKVTDMSYMFSVASSANPDISNWDVSNVKNMQGMLQGSVVKALNLSSWKLNQDLLNDNSKMQDIFKLCPNIECLKTPKGLKTYISGPNTNFKIVRLKKDSAPFIEQESKNLNYNYEINNDGDSSAIYHIYNKNKYAGVTFDKNNGDRESWINHEIIEKGEEFGEGGGIVPSENPTYEGYEFLGWAKNNSATISDFDEHTVILQDMKIYSMWGRSKAKVTLDGNGGVLASGAQASIDIEKGENIRAALEAAVANNMFTKPGYKLVGFSKSKFATAADYNLDAPVYSDMTLYAIYEEINEVTTVTIKYSDIDLGEDAKIEGVKVGKPIGVKLDGNARHRDGYRFLGYSKAQNAAKPDFFKKSIVTENLVIYPVYKEAANEDKVKVAFKLNDGTDANLKTEEVTRYESLGNKMPTKDKVAERDGYLFIGWAKSKAAKYPDFFRGTTVKGDMTVYAVWKSLYDEKLGQAVLKVAAKAKGYELTIEPPKANLHTGFEIFRSEKKDFKPSKDNKIATIDRNTLKYLDEKADNGKAYYYAVRAIDEDGSYNGTKVTFIGKLSDKVLAAPLPKDKGVTATVAGKGAVDLEFNKTMAAAGYKVTVTAPYDKKFKTIERFVEAGKLAAAGGNKVKANLTGLPMGKFLAFKLEALEADNNKLVEYGNSFAFMLGAVEKLSAKVNKKKRVLNIKFKAMKGVNGYEAKIVIGGKVKIIKLKKGKKKLRGFIVGSIKLPKKKGNYTFTIRAFKKIGKLKYYGQTITKVVK